MSKWFCLIFLCLTQLIFAQDDHPAVLLIPDSVANSEVLATAAGSDVLVISYNTRETSLGQLLEKVETKLAGRLAASIGFAVHDYGEAKFYITEAETISLGSTLSSQSQREFWQGLGGLVAEEGRIDIFACRLASTEQGGMLVSALKRVSGVEVAASANDTGNSAKGGDWILETAALDVSYSYFTPAKLNNYKGLLWGERKKIYAGDSGAFKFFGCSVSISGDHAVIGAYGDSQKGSGAGAAYIFSRSAGGENSWVQIKKLIAPDGTYWDLFGGDVSISGDYAIVGSQEDDDNGDMSGSAYLFYRHQGGQDNWGLLKKLRASDASSTDMFGKSVCIDGDYAIVGAYFAPNNPSGVSTGAAYIFYRDEGGSNNWGEIKKVQPFDGVSLDSFGYSVSIAGDYVIVGASEDDDKGMGSGSAYIFFRHQGGADNWGLQQKVTASDGASQDYFGSSVSISGDYAIVGSASDDDGGSNSGSAYIFYRNQGGDNNWGQSKKIRPSRSFAGASFGADVSILGDYALVGAGGDNSIAYKSGAAYLFNRNQGGINNWGEVKQITAMDAKASGSYGISIGLSSDMIVVGTKDSDLGSNAGAGYIVDASLFELIVNPASNGSTDKDGRNLVETGEAFTILAIPDSNYRLSNWTGDVSGSQNPLNLDNISSDLSITPVFARQKGTLIVNIAPGGSNGSYSISGPADFNGGNILAGQTGNYNQLVPTGDYTITFSSPDAGYGLVVSSSDFTVSGYSGAGNLAYNSSMEVTGTYTQGKYRVLVTNASGGTTNKTGYNEVNQGDSLTVQATAESGYSFIGWTGDMISSFNPLTINNISADMTISPNFASGTATLTVSIAADSSGATYTISGPSAFNGGQPLRGQVDAFSSNVPGGSYIITYDNITNWGVTVTATGMNVIGNIATTTLGIGDVATVSGNYKRGQYSVTVPTVSGGTTDRNGINAVSQNGSITITATASAEHEFAGWTGDVSSSDNPLIINNITRDYTVTPMFEALPGKGHLEVTLLGTSEGKWRLKGEKSWRGSGITVMNLPTGEHLIECKPVQGYHTPEIRSVLISHKQTSYIVVEYIALLAKPVVHYFTATPDLVEQGGIVTLEWEVDGADEVELNAGSGQNWKTQGEAKLNVDSNSSFQLMAINKDGNSTAQAEVVVVPKSEIVFFRSSNGPDSPLYPGKSASLSWFVTGANSIVLLNKSTGDMTFLESEQGSLEVAPEATTEFILRCSNSLSQVESSSTVVVDDSVIVNSFRANCSKIFRGNKVNLSWDVQGVETVEITPAVGEVNHVGEAEVQISETTVFTLKAGDQEEQMTVFAVDQAPDLEVSFQEVKDRWGKNLKKPTKGQLVTLQAKVENKGTEACSSLVMQLEDGSRVVDRLNVANLAAGSTETIEFTWSPRKAGKHKMLLTADPGDLISEASETNNLSTKKIRVKNSGGIDILTDDLHVDLAADGRTAKVSYSIINVGNETSGSFQYQVYLAKGAQKKLNKAIALVEDRYLQSLAPGEVKSFTKVVKLKKNFKRIHIIAEVDVHNAITEVNEVNNKQARRVK